MIRVWWVRTEEHLITVEVYPIASGELAAEKVETGGLLRELNQTILKAPFVLSLHSKQLKQRVSFERISEPN